MYRLPSLLAIVSILACPAWAQEGYNDQPAWSVLVKPVGNPVPTYSLLDGPTKTRDYTVKNVTASAITITDVRAGCDCVTPSIPAVGIDGRPQKLPLILAAGDTALLQVTMHIDHFTPGTLDETVEILGQVGNGLTITDLGAFYVRAAISSPVSAVITRPGDQTGASYALPDQVDIGDLRVGERWTSVLKVTLSADSRLRDVALQSQSPTIRVTREPNASTYDVAVRTDSPKPSFLETLQLVSGRSKVRGVSLQVAGRVDGDIRVEPESLMLSLYRKSGQPVMLDPLDPAAATIDVLGRDTRMPQPRIVFDHKLLAVATVDGGADDDSMPGWRRTARLSIQVAPDVVKAYREHGTIPAEARPLSTSPRGVSDTDRVNPSPAMRTSIRVIPTSGQPVDIPVTVLIPEFAEEVTARH